MNICFSGGAQGADTLWGDLALNAGHKLIHYIFNGHKSTCPYTKILTQQELDFADKFLNYANKTLNRHFPTKSLFVNNLLRRNFYQVRNSTSVYAIARISNGLVEGGTAWAVQMFIDKNKGASCPCYVYCQTANKWYRWTEEWVECVPPRPQGAWTGIGSRDLTAQGIAAAQELFNV